jgi:small subunit ribosomal protein S6
MRHYEIVMMIHPDQSEQVPAMVQRYLDVVVKAKGQVHRQEDWGRRQLAYSINKIHKAHYVMINIECDQPTLNEITNAFRFNDAIIRHLVTKRDEAITSVSPIMKEKEKENERARRDRGSRHRSESNGDLNENSGKSDDVTIDDGTVTE